MNSILSYESKELRIKDCLSKYGTTVLLGPNFYFNSLKTEDIIYENSLITLSTTLVDN